MRREATLAALAIVASQTSINLGAALAKTLFAELGADGVAALRTTLAALMLLVLARPWRVRLMPRQAMWLVLYGLMLGGMSLFIYLAIERIPIGLAVAIEIGGPLAVVLATSRSLRDLLWLLLAVGGVLLLVPWPGTARPLDPLGILFALAAAACWALYIPCGKRASVVGGRAAVAIGMAVASLATLPFGLSSAGARLLSAQTLGSGLVLALLSSTVPFLLEMTALARLTTRQFGVVTSAAPAIAALVGFAALGETLPGPQLAAIAMIVTASAGCALTSRATPGTTGTTGEVIA